ncbi:MAG: hypothetical protein B7Z80_18095 [Rhodospirillales bacterium 20-64-7]|nr:MAG: hypothetical protein B7Z80_18095 [Rhodospirillales bacterium 20-64-7]
MNGLGLHVAVMALVGAVVWRLGGGAFTTITGWNFGTDPARVLRSSLAMVLPAFGPWFVPQVLLLFLGICIGGWGAFQGMGLAVSVPEPSWKRWLPNALGFKAGTLAHDFIGMMESGVSSMAPLAAVYVWFDHIAALGIMVAGLGFAPCYLLARLPLPTIPQFATGGEWGEVFTGAFLGAAFVLISHFAPFHGAFYEHYHIN